MDIGVMKPIATGGLWVRRNGTIQLVSPDALRLSRAAGVDEPWSLINPVCFRDPLAPYPASIRSHQPIAWSAMERAFRTLARRHPVLIVEGIGGLLVPLTRHHTVAHLIRRFALPCLIVSRRRLGTVNHTLLTVKQAKQEGIPVLGVVLNAAERPAVDAGGKLAEQTNPAVLKACLPVPLVGELPYRAAFTDGSWTRSALVHWIERSMDQRFLRQLLRMGR